MLDKVRAGQLHFSKDGSKSFTVFLSRIGAFGNSKYISQNNLYKQQNSLDYLQNPVSFSKSLVYLKLNIFINEHVSASQCQVLVSLSFD